MFFLLLVISVTTVSGFTQKFTLTTTAANTVSSKSTIDMPGLAGNPNAIIVATPTGNTATLNPHPIGAWYYNGKWNIFNTDHATMPPGLIYKIQVFPAAGPNHFLHVVTRDNLSEAASYIDTPALNNNPNAQVYILQNHAPDNRAYNLNANEARATYNPSSGKWYIANVNGKPLYPNTVYNVIAVGGTNDDSIRPVSAQPFPTRTREPMPVPVATRTREPMPVQPVQPEPTYTRERMEIGTVQNRATASNAAMAAPSGGACTNEMARQTVGKWGPQKADDLAMADRTFPKTGYKAVLAKAQQVIELFKIANPEFRGIEARAYRGIRGESIIPNGPLPFRADVWYGSFICIGNDTYKIDMRGKIIVHGNYGFTVVSFNSLTDVLQSPSDGAPFLTADGEEIREYNKDLGEFKGFPFIQTSHRDSYHEAVIIWANDRLPYKPVTREQYLRARIKIYQSGGGMAEVIAGLNRALENMSPSERQSPAIVRDVSALPGGTRLFATEAEGGRHLVVVDKSYFNPKLPRDNIQLITVHWHSSPNDPGDRPKVEMLRAFKENFDFIALLEMLDNQR